MIALSSCKQQHKRVIQNNFCESYEVLKISEDIAKYIDQIKNKIKEEKITTIEEKFAYLMLNSLSKAPLVPKNHPFLNESLHHEI